MQRSLDVGEASLGALETRRAAVRSGNGQLALPIGIGVDGENNVYVSDYDNHRIQKFSGSGVFVTKWGSAGTS